MSTQENLLPAVHGLRGVAAMMILVLHVHGIHQLALPSSMSFVATHFGLGVHLFFVLSAFSLFVSTRHRVGRAFWVRDYFMRRFFRIAPLFYVMLVLWSVFGWYAWHRSPPLYELFFNFTFLFNLFPGKHESIVWAGWTIGVEMLFYALLPALLVNVRGLPSAVALFLAGTTVSSAARLSYAQQGGVLASYGDLSFLSNFGVFCAGVLGYFVFQSRLARGALPGGLARGHLCSLAGLGLVLLLYYGALDALKPLHRLDIALWALAFGLLIAGQAARPWPVLANRALFFVGERSFSVYLLHPFIIYNLRGVYTSIYAAAGSVPWVAFPACVVVTIAVVMLAATLSYRLIERPGMALGRRAMRRHIPASREDHVAAVGSLGRV